MDSQDPAQAELTFKLAMEGVADQYSRYVSGSIALRAR